MRSEISLEHIDSFRTSDTHLLLSLSHPFPISTPTNRAGSKEPDPSLKDEIGETETEKEQPEEKQTEAKELEGVRREDKEDEEDCGLELELRNTDSVFSELSELSHDYVESVDQGASVRGKVTQRSRLLHK